MVVTNTSRPPSRRQQGSNNQKNAAVPEKYSTISASILSELLQSPNAMKSSAEHVQEGQVRESKSSNKTQQQRMDNTCPVILPSIFPDRHAESQHEIMNPNNRKFWNADTLAEAPTKQLVRPGTPVDDYLHNKMKSTRGCSVVVEDELEKQMRQKSVLKQQIEERRLQQELKEEQKRRQLAEEDERVQRELSILQRRWEKEIQNEKRQQIIPSTKKSSSSASSSSSRSKSPAVISGSNSPASSSKDDFVKPAQSASVLPGLQALPEPETISEGKEGPRSPALSSTEKSKFQENIQSLSQLCAKLMEEQKRMKSELEEQRRQTLIALQDRRLNESLQEQLHALQEQLALLTPHERAMIRIRDRRRKQETRISPHAQKPERTKETHPLSNTLNAKLNKHTKKRGSWATQSKALAPAPTHSISEDVFEGEVSRSSDSRAFDQELGSTTRFLYPGDIWDLRVCDSRLDRGHSARMLSRRSLLEEQQQEEEGEETVVEDNDIYQEVLSSQPKNPQISSQQSEARRKRIPVKTTSHRWQTMQQ